MKNSLNRIWGWDHSLLAFIVGVLLLSLLLASMSSAADLSTGLNAAIVNIPPGADVAGMGNAWTATPIFSSNNPAVFSIETGEEKIKASLSGTFGIISFKNGPEVKLYSGTVMSALPIGKLQLSYSDANSNSSATKMDMRMEVDAVPTFDLQYAFKAGKSILLSGDELHLGMGYTYAESKLKFAFPLELPEIGMFNAQSTGFSQSHSASVGAVYRPNKKFNVGVMFRKTWSDDEEKFKISELEISEKISGKSQADQLRLGIGWQLLDMTFIAADYQHLDFEGVKVDQLFFGIEQGIVKDFLYLYAGLADESPTCGIGVYLPKGGLNVGYMHNFVPELNEHLGKSNVWIFSGYYNF